MVIMPNFRKIDETGKLEQRSICRKFSAGRHATVKIGQVRVGWEVPVVVQSMTNTDTADIAGTIEQVAALAMAGSEIVRVTVNNEDAAAAVPHIVEGLDKRGLRVPIVGDFHYNGHLLLKKFPATARALAKYRINPGNASIGKKDNDNFQVMVECAVGEPEAGAHRRQLGLPRSGSVDPHDGREQPLSRAAARPRSHDGGHGGQRAGIRQGCRALSACVLTRSFSLPKSAGCAT